MKKITGFMIALMIVFISSLGAAQAEEEKFYQKSDPWVYTITHKTVISNPGKEAIRNVRVTIPLMDTNQPVYQELLGEELSPWPVKIVRSGKGTRQGVFEIPSIAPGKSVILEQRYGVRNYAIHYQIEPRQIAEADDNEKIDSRYLQPETKIESDHPLIVGYARDVVKDETNPYVMAQKLFADINLFMTYRNNPDDAWKGALNAILTGKGNCEDYTDLFVAAARAVGIPARWKTGYLYLPKEYNSPPYIQEDGSLDISLMRHTWPEIYLPDVGWMVLDPTYTYTIKSGKKEEKTVDWSKFGKIESSSRHIFFSYGNHDEKYGIEYKSSGPKPDVKFSENLVFGNNVIPFRDVSGHWARDSIRFLAGLTPSIIGGYGNGLFGPNDPVTRAQLAAMLNRALSLNYPVSKPQFTDVAPGYWGYADIATAKAAGIVAGFPDGTFRPEKHVSRAELAAIFCRAFNLSKPDESPTFRDLGQSGFIWADSSIITLAGNGIAGGYPGGFFGPEKTVTRAEVAVFLSRVMDGVFRLKVN